MYEPYWVIHRWVSAGHIKKHNTEGGHTSIKSIEKTLFGAFDMDSSNLFTSDHATRKTKYEELCKKINQEHAWFNGPHALTMFKALLIKKGAKDI